MLILSYNWEEKLLVASVVDILELENGTHGESGMTISTFSVVTERKDLIYTCNSHESERLHSLYLAREIAKKLG